MIKNHVFSYWDCIVLPTRIIDDQRIDPKTLDSTIEKLRCGQYNQAGLDKKSTSHYDNDLYTVWLNDEHRLVFTTIIHDNKRCLYLIEFINKHQYQKSLYVDSSQALKKSIDRLIDNPNPLENCQVVMPYNDQEIALKPDDERLVFEPLFSYHHHTINLTFEQQCALTKKLPLLISGEPGSGKTATGTALLRERQKTCTIDFKQNDSPSNLWVEKRGISNNNRITRVCEDIKKDNEPYLLYLTNSPKLVEFAKRQFEFYGNANSIAVNFKTYEECFLAQQSGKKLVDYDMFSCWMRKEVGKIQKQDERINLFNTHDKVILNDTATLYLECRTLSGYTKEDYSALSSRDSLIDNKLVRDWLYDTFLSYLTYLEQQKLCDLAFSTVNLVPKPSLIVVDEAQDFSSQQLAALWNTAHEQQIVFLADSNQSLQDFNSKQHVLKYFAFKRQQKLEILHLNKTLRCPKNIVTLANKVLELKSLLCSDRMTKGEIKPLESANTRQSNVYWLEDRHLKEKGDVLTYLASSPNHAVIIFSEEDRKKASTLIPTPLIFLAQEVKGLEYQTIIAYNPLNDDPLVKTINKCLNDRPNKEKSPQLTSFFNTLHTAVTRALKDVIVIQNTYHHNNGLLQQLQSASQFDEPFPLVSLKSTYDGFRWKQEARRLLQQGHEVQAYAIMRELYHTKNYPSLSELLTEMRQQLPAETEQTLFNRIISTKDEDFLAYQLSHNKNKSLQTKGNAITPSQEADLTERSKKKKKKKNKKKKNLSSGKTESAQTSVVIDTPTTFNDLFTNLDFKNPPWSFIFSDSSQKPLVMWVDFTQNKTSIGKFINHLKTLPNEVGQQFTSALIDERNNTYLSFLFKHSWNLLLPRLFEFISEKDSSSWLRAIIAYPNKVSKEMDQPIDIKEWAENAIFYKMFKPYGHLKFNEISFQQLSTWFNRCPVLTEQLTGKMLEAPFIQGDKQVSIFRISLVTATSLKLLAFMLDTNKKLYQELDGKSLFKVDTGTGLPPFVELTCTENIAAESVRLFKNLIDNNPKIVRHITPDFFQKRFSTELGRVGALEFYSRGPGKELVEHLLIREPAIANFITIDQLTELRVAPVYGNHKWSFFTFFMTGSTNILNLLINHHKTLAIAITIDILIDTARKYNNLMSLHDNTKKIHNDLDCLWTINFWNTEYKINTLSSLLANNLEITRCLDIKLLDDDFSQDILTADKGFLAFAMLLNHNKDRDKLIAQLNENLLLTTNKHFLNNSFFTFLCCDSTKHSLLITLFEKNSSLFSNLARELLFLPVPSLQGSCTIFYHLAINQATHTLLEQLLQNKQNSHISSQSLKNGLCEGPAGSESDAYTMLKKSLSGKRICNIILKVFSSYFPKKNNCSTTENSITSNVLTKQTEQQFFKASTPSSQTNDQSSELPSSHSPLPR